MGNEMGAVGLAKSPPFQNKLRHQVSEDPAMPATLNSVYALAQELSLADRHALANRLFDQLEEGEADGTPEEIEAAWAEEIRSRLKAIDDGSAKWISEQDFDLSLQEMKQRRA